MSPRKKRSPSSRRLSLTIAAKANNVLNLIFLVIIFIAIRVWHLAVIQHEERLEVAKRPQNRSVIECAERGSIRDRFNLPIAINKVQYNAAVFYAHIREIPTVIWLRNSQGERIKSYQRREHISRLATLLSEELCMDAERIEDLIHSKAALFPNTPFVIKEDISEKEYFRLKMLEKDYLGLYGERVPKRYYPQERVASDIIGYMGAISRQEYLAIAEEMETLREILQAWRREEMPAFPQGMASITEIENRLQDLEQKAYTINDSIGKVGIEGEFDEVLRGYYGKRTYHADAKGNFLRELPGGREPLSGQRVTLSISSELQKFAEGLLAQNEEIRDGKSTTFDWSKRSYLSLKQPWIKGGGIVVMEPNTGEVLALASYPRTNPNDFISSGNSEDRKAKASNIGKWFESESYLAEIWDGKRFLERERYRDLKGEMYDEKKELTWDLYLDFILPKENPARRAMGEVKNLKNAVVLQTVAEDLLKLSGQEKLYSVLNILYEEQGHVSYQDRISNSEKDLIRERFRNASGQVKSLKKEMDRFLSSVPHNYDKVLVVDLCRLAVKGDRFSSGLIKEVGQQSISSYREVSMAMAVIVDLVRSMTKELFHEINFKHWREINQKKFLREKRKEEKTNKRYARPYLDHLDRKERELFNIFWDKYSFIFTAFFLVGETPVYEIFPEYFTNYFEYFTVWREELAKGAHSFVPWRRHYQRLKFAVEKIPKKFVTDYLQTIRSFDELNLPLYGSYRNIRREKRVLLEKHLAAAFYPLYGFGYGRSQAYRQAAPLGSIFKLVVAYEALIQRFNLLVDQGGNLENLNPLEIVDKVQRIGGRKKSWVVGYDMQGQAIPQFYKGGRLPRSERRNIGHIDLAGAIEVSSNPYFAILAADILNDPEDINRAANRFCFGSKTGIDLSGEIAGKLPRDILENKTGLYAYAIGQHSLVATPLQTSVMMSALVNGGKVLKPKIVNAILGKEPLRNKDQIVLENHFKFKKSLAFSGEGLPPFTSVQPQKQKKYFLDVPTKVHSQVLMPKEVNEILMEGMFNVVNSKRGSARPSSINGYYSYPHILRDYADMKNQIIGKTSTAEIVEAVDLDLEMGVYRYKHIWFAGVSFLPKEQRGVGKGFFLEDVYGKPELVVIVYLRFGDYGHEAAPLVAQIVKKWREIKKKHPYEESS